MSDREEDEDVLKISQLLFDNNSYNDQIWDSNAKNILRLDCDEGRRFYKLSMNKRRSRKKSRHEEHHEEKEGAWVHHCDDNYSSIVVNKAPSAGHCGSSKNSNFHQLHRQERKQDEVAKLEEENEVSSHLLTNDISCNINDSLEYNTNIQHGNGIPLTNKKNHLHPPTQGRKEDTKERASFIGVSKPNGMIEGDDELLIYEAGHIFLTESTSSSGSFVKAVICNIYGPVQIMIMSLILSLAGGSVVGVTPELITDRCAQYYYGLKEGTSCASFTTLPPECHEGSQKAQTLSVYASLCGNITTFTTSALAGAISDSYGRRFMILLGLTVTLVTPLGFVVWSTNANVNPMIFTFVIGIVCSFLDWFPVALSSLSDCIEEQWRAATFGLLAAVFAFGYAVGPSFALLANSNHLLIASFLAQLMVLILTTCFFPETVPSSTTRQEQEDDKENVADGQLEQEDDNEDIPGGQQAQHISALLFEDETGSEHSQQQTHLEEPFLAAHFDTHQQQQHSTLRTCWASSSCRKNSVNSSLKKLTIFLCQPITDMSILMRTYTLRLLSLLALLSGIVGGADGSLLLYYAQDQLNINLSDIALMSVWRGVFGMIFQGLLLKPINEAIGERNLLMISFTFGTLHNLVIGLARNKITFSIGIILGSVLSMSFATVSAIKSMNVSPNEQGQIQGALYSLQSLSWALGPVMLRAMATTSLAKATGIPGIMFVMASVFYLFAVFLSYMLPPEHSDSRLTTRQRPCHEGLQR